LDSNGNRVAPGYQWNPSPIPIQPLNVFYTATSTITDVTINQFLTDVGAQAPIANTWPLRPRIQATFVYLTDEERAQFSSESLQYLVRQVTPYSFDAITSRQFVDLYTHNPIERLIIVPRRSDTIYRNQSSNFTNWVDPQQPPFIPPFLQTNMAGSNSWYPGVYTSGQYVLNGQRPILNTLTVLGDGNPLQEDKPNTYFTQVVPWKYLSGIPDPELLIYPFLLKANPMQPCGSINSSRIKSFQVDLNVFPLPPNTLYQYNIMIYVESLNWVNVASGMGGLKYAL
jgi:hypothetical protein